MGSSSSNKKKSKRSSRQQDEHQVGNDHQQQQAFFNNDFYAEQTPLRRRENDSIFSAVDAPMYSDYPNSNSSNNNNNAGRDLLFMHSARTRKNNNNSNSSFHAQYSQQHSTTVDRWVKQAMRFILLSPVIVLVLWWSTAVLFVNHHSSQQQQQHSHSQQQQQQQQHQQTVNSNKRGFSLPAAFKPHNRQAQAQAIHQNNNLNNIQQYRKFFPFGAAPQSSQQQVILLPPAAGDSGGDGYTLLDGQQPQFISQDQQPMVGSDYGGQEQQQQQLLLPMARNDGTTLMLTQPMTGLESAAQRGMMMMAEQPNNDALMGKSFVYYSPPTGTFPPMPVRTTSSSYNAPLMGASSSYTAPLMGAASSYNAPMMGSMSDNTHINGKNPLFMIPPLELDQNNRVQARVRPHPRAGDALSDYIHQQNHQGHGLLRGTSSTSNTRYYYYDPNQVVMDAQNNVQQLPDVIYDQAGNALSLDQLTLAAQAQQLPIYLQALEEQERNPFGVHHFSNGTNFNSTTGTVTTSNYTQTHPNTVETPVHRQLPYYPPVGGASIVEAPPVQQLSFNAPVSHKTSSSSSSSFTSWGENTAADNSIILCTVAVMALLVGALSARRLRARSILSACIENESLTTRNQEAYDAAYTMNDEGGAYATFAAPAASHWKGDLEKFDV